jgi:hypothetical protein
MAVTFDANATADQTLNAVTSITTTNLTVGSGLQRALVVQVCWGATAGLPVTTPTATWDFGGSAQNCPLIGSQVSTTVLESALFGLVNPVSGAKTLKVAWTTSADVVINPLSYTLVDQTGGATTFPHFTSNVNSASPSTVTITSATGNATVSCVSVAGNPAGPSQTQTFLDTSPANLSAAGERGAGGATVTHQWSTAGGQYVMVGCDILAASAVVGGPAPDPIVAHRPAPWKPSASTLRGF